MKKSKCLILCKLFAKLYFVHPFMSLCKMCINQFSLRFADDAEVLLRRPQLKPLHLHNSPALSRFVFRTFFLQECQPVTHRPAPVSGIFRPNLENLKWLSTSVIACLLLYWLNFTFSRKLSLGRGIKGGDVQVLFLVFE